MDANTTGQEIELKLLCTPAAYDGLRELPVIQHLATGVATTTHLRTCYFDTATYDLRKRGLSLRLRYDEDGIIQCVKSRKERLGGLEFRGEYESRLAEPVPDLGTIPDSKVRRRLRRLGKSGFSPLFETRFQRISWPLLTPGGTRLRLDLDRGEICIGDQCEALCELELELVQGDPAGLFDLALEINQHLPLQLSTLSKAERGYARLTGQPLGAVKGKPVLLPADANTGMVLMQIMQNGLEHLVSNETGLLHGAENEAVHQARVALRRLRTFEGLFRKQFPNDDTHWLRTELKWLHHAFAPLRDWAVLQSELVEEVKCGLEKEPSLQPLLAHLEVLRGVNALAVANVFRSPRCTQFLLAFGLWLFRLREQYTSAERNERALVKPARAFAQEVLAKNFLRVSRRAKNFQSKTDEGRHRLRIELKKLRYAARGFQSLYPAKRTKPFLAAAGRLQDALGHLNDVANARKLLSDLADEASDRPEAGLHFSAGVVLGWHMQKRTRLLRRAECALKKFSECKPFW